MLPYRQLQSVIENDGIFFPIVFVAYHERDMVHHSDKSSSFQDTYHKRVSLVFGGAHSFQSSSFEITYIKG